MKTKKLNTAPINSMMNVVSNTLFIKRTIPLLESRLEASRIKRRPFRSNFLPIAKMTPAPMDVTPSPPICINRARKNCPIGVKVSPASTAISPVTQTALVEVFGNRFLLCFCLSCIAKPYTNGLCVGAI